MQELSQETKDLASKYLLWQKSLKSKDTPTIHVDEVASKVAGFYEKIRTIIDWKEEHLMKRAAIIRKLKRRFLDLELNNFTTENIAEHLVMELIRGGYFPNDKIEESKIGEIQKIIEKYVFILKHSPENKKGKAGLQFYNNLLEIAACEIEETLDPAIREMSLIEYMFNMMRERIKVSDAVYEKNLLKKEETDIQIYIAVQRSLFKLDDPIISYNVIKYKYPNWQSPSEEELLKFSQNMYKILKVLEDDLIHPFGKKFYTICEKYDTPYLLLGDILVKTDAEQINTNIYEPALLEKSIKEAYTNRLKDLRARITRAAIYSTASIFITKILTLMVLGLVIGWIFNEKFNTGFFIAEILIPTTLMALLVASVRPPSRKNIYLAVMETMKIVYKKDKIDTYEIRVARKRNFITRLILSLFYVTSTFVSFGLIYWAFSDFGFPLSSIIINIIFIALILFAGTAIQKRSQELTIEEESEGFLAFVSDILFLPITGMGRWLSNTWKQYNAIAALFNALIDMPFSTFIEFLEGWRYFIKEKKEEIR